MTTTGEVTIEKNGKTYGATYSVSNGMLHVKTHTETREIEILDKDAETLARGALLEIVNSQSKR